MSRQFQGRKPEKPAEPPVIAGRVPPHDLDLEASVLSAILLDRDALDRVLEFLKAEHFYSEANGRIFEAATELAIARIPVDVVSVAAWLRDRGRLAQVGGPSYLAQLTDATPAVAHVEFHARMVREKWRLRQLIATCQRVSAEGYGDVGVVQEFIDSAEQAVYDIARTPEATSVQPIAAVLRAAFEQMSAAQKSVGSITGTSTGFERLDGKTAGLHDGDLTIVAARPGMGKAQPLDAKVLTPAGWRTIGSLRVGDIVTHATTGKPVPVVGVYDRGELDVFRVEMTDGASTECCDDHLWLTRTRANRRARKPGSVKSLREIRTTMARGGGGKNHCIPYAAPVEFESISDDLPLDPYLLGVWLGDGGSSQATAHIDNPEADIRERIAQLAPMGDSLRLHDDGLHIAFRRTERAHRTVSETLRALRVLGLADHRSWEKFIPEVYLRAPIASRIKLLQGLCDTDGYVTGGGRIVEYLTTSPRLASGIEFLVGSLGGLTTWSTKKTHYRTSDGGRVACRDAVRMLIRFPGGEVTPVSSQKHLAKWANGRMRMPERFIASVAPAGRKLCRCIAIDAPDHLYVTDGFIVTHNTSFVLNLGVNVASPRPWEWTTPSGTDGKVTANGHGVAIFSLEMPREQLATRLVCAEGRVDVGKLRQGFLQADDWRRLTEAASFLSKLPLWIDDTGSISLLELRAKVRRIQAEYNRPATETTPERRLGLVVIDYLQLMKGREGVSNREQEISEISRGLKALAKELRVPVIALSQLNRAVETRSTKDKRPQLADLRESGAIEQDSDTIIFIYRDEYYNPETTNQKGIAELIIAKQRNGPTGKVLVRFASSYTRFDNLAPGDYPTDAEDE